MVIKKQLKKKPGKSVRPVKKNSSNSKKNKKIVKKNPSLRSPSVRTSTTLVETRTVIVGGSSISMSDQQLSEPRSIFDLAMSSIDGETMIGDLLVVFPRTREIFMKHGVNFDVEEAGYVYMTLNVFSALHGLKINTLIDDLVMKSKEVPIPLAPPAVSPLPKQGQVSRQHEVATVASAP